MCFSRRLQQLYSKVQPARNILFFSIVLFQGIIHYRKHRILLHFNNDLRSYMWLCKPVSFLACFNDFSSFLRIDLPNSPWLAHQIKSSDLKYHCISAHLRKAASISMVLCPCHGLSLPCAVFSWLFRLFIIISSFLFFSGIRKHIILARLYLISTYCTYWQNRNQAFSI